MRKLVAAACFAAGVVVASAAQAENWWLVAGGLNSPELVFIDTDSVARDGSASFRFQALDFARAGTVEQVTAVADCAAGAQRGQIAAFVCASAAERDKLGVALGALTPIQAVRALWAPGGSDTPRAANIA